LLAVVLVGCGSSLPAPAHKNLMDETTAGQNRCAITKSHERPFVIEWDATDLASFEAKAQRDVVFVRYEGCNLTVLYGCSDSSVPGKLGTYGQPIVTAGAVEAVDIANESELYAQLPLAAASLSARVQAGDALHMRYFVSGVVTSTRDSIAKSALTPYAACNDATHFVWAYNLGGFELTSQAHDRTEGSAALGAAGAGGGRASSEKRLKSGGDLASCTGETAAVTRACRVPIRLALRALSEGGEPIAPAPADAGAAPVANEDARKALRAVLDRARETTAIRIEASRKNELGDGEGCLADLDRLARERRGGAESDDDLRARCEMRAGRCAAGKTRYRQVLENEASRTGRSVDVDAQVESAAAKYCSSGGTPKERALRARDAITKAARRPDPAACVSAGKDLVKAAGELSPAERGMLLDYAMNAVECAAKGAKCGEAKDLYAAHFKLVNPRASAAQADVGFGMIAGGTPCAR
jgi:hypothetical protein